MGYTRCMMNRVLVGILLAVAAGVVVHAPLTVWLGTVWPDGAVYVKAWKELLMGVALVLLIVQATRQQQVGVLLRSGVMTISLLYALLHFVLAVTMGGTIEQVQAGLLIDLRYVLYFVLVYGTLRLLPQYRTMFIKTFAAGAVVVLGFAVLQVTVLPRDFLAHIGYGVHTIQPYLLVDDNPDLVRISSTLRGPNPLGVYAAVVLAILAAAVAKWRLTNKQQIVAAALAAAAVTSLWASYSRSALAAAAVAVAIVALVAASARTRRQLVVWGGVAVVILAVFVVVLRDSYFVSNVVLHDNPATGAQVNSNQAHLDSLGDGTGRVLGKPFGAGVGSTGSASLLGDHGLIIENQYLFTAHEVGWVGLGVFLILFLNILRKLWDERRHVLPLGVFASGVGLALVGVLLPVWVDDTVSIVWWGLAAVVIGGIDGKRTRYKKATRTT